MITMSKIEFASRLKNLHLTSQAAAIALGVSQRQVFYYLSGESPVPDTVAILLRTKTALLEALGALQELDPEWLNRCPDPTLLPGSPYRHSTPKSVAGRYHGVAYPRKALSQA